MTTALAIIPASLTCEVCESLDGLRLVGDVTSRLGGQLRLCLGCAESMAEMEREEESSPTGMLD